MPSAYTGSGKKTDIKRVLSRVVEVSTLPEVAMKIMKVVDQPDSGASDLLQVVEIDPALSSRILRTLRSAKYGLRVEILDLQQAIGYLGFKEIRNLALTGSISGIFQTELKINQYCRAGLWNHMVGTAVCSKMLASRMRLPAFEDAYVAGLLHDMGIVLMDEHLNEDFKMILARTDEDTPLADLEKEIVGFTHMRLGAALADKWQFPSLAKDAMQYHHDTSDCDGPGWQILACVEAANFICSAIGLPSVGLNSIKPPKETFKRLKLTKRDLIVVAEDLRDRLTNNTMMLPV